MFVGRSRVAFGGEENRKTTHPQTHRETHVRQGGSLNKKVTAKILYKGCCKIASGFLPYALL